LDKRTLSALLLMLVLYLAFDQFVWKPQRESARLATQSEQLPQDPALADSLDQEEPVPVSAAADSLIGTENAEVKEVELENDYLKVRFSNKGAVITSIELKEYNFSDGVAVDLIPEMGSILSTTVYQGSQNLDLSSRIFAYSEDPDTKSIRFHLGAEASPQILREYYLDDMYGIGVETSIQNLGSMNGIRLDLSAGIADSEKQTKSKAQDYRFLLYADNELLKLSLAKMKNHDICGITLSMKNMFGAIPNAIYADPGNEYTNNAKGAMHDGSRNTEMPNVILPTLRPGNPGYRLPRIITDICRARPIDLAIIDGITSMSGGEGEWNGSQLHVAAPGLLVAGMNCVCTDSVGAYLMGFDPKAEGWTKPFYNGDNTFQLATDRWLGTNDLEQIEVVGLDPDEARYAFMPGKKN